jgi:hypothetical protein
LLRNKGETTPFTQVFRLLPQCSRHNICFLRIPGSNKNQIDRRWAVPEALKQKRRADKRAETRAARLWPSQWASRHYQPRLLELESTRMKDTLVKNSLYGSCDRVMLH